MTSQNIANAQKEIDRLEAEANHADTKAAGSSTDARGGARKTAASGEPATNGSATPSASASAEAKAEVEKELDEDRDLAAEMEQSKIKDENAPEQITGELAS